jgi:hypothetical protein
MIFRLFTRVIKWKMAEKQRRVKQGRKSKAEEQQ